MLFIRITCLLVSICLCGAQQWVYPPKIPYPTRGRYESCSTALEDLNVLLQLAKTLDDDYKGCCPQNQPNSCLSDEIIIKLVNALIYTATHNCGPKHDHGCKGGSGGHGSGGGVGVGLGAGVGAGVGGGVGGESGGGLGVGVGAGLGAGLGVALGDVLGVGVGAGVGAGLGAGLGDILVLD